MRRISLAALILAGGAASQTATAQSLAESVFTATITQSVESDSNFRLNDKSPGTTTFADTRVRLQLDQGSETRNLSLGIDTGLRALWEADEDFDFEAASPSSAFLLFENEGLDTTFDADLRVRTRRVDFDDPLADFVTDEGVLTDDINQLDDETSEIRYDANIGFALGTSSPSTYGIRFIGSDIDYNDQAEGDNLTPRRTLEGRAFWTLRINPVLSSAVRGSYLLYEADDAQRTEVRVSEIDAGVVYEPDETLLLRAGIGYADREREETNFFGNRVLTENNDGPVVRGDFRYILPDLTLSGDARWTTAAPSNRLSFNLRGNYALSRGRITGRLFNRYTGGQEGDEQRITGVGLGVTRDINTRSRFGVDISFAHQENLDNNRDPDIDRGDLTTRYTYDIQRDLSAQIGYRYRTRVEDPNIDADSHRVFFNIAKTFTTGL